MAKTTSNGCVGNLTLRELRDIIREVVREEVSSRWRVDKDGNLIFLFEEDYAAYLAKQKSKLPSGVRAYFIDEQGFTVRYADEVPTAKTWRRIEDAKREIAEGKGLSLGEVRQRLRSR
jgi:hypothetical protein